MVEKHYEILQEVRSLSKRAFSLWRLIRLFLMVARDGVAPAMDAALAKTSIILESFEDLNKVLSAGEDKHYKKSITKAVQRTISGTTAQVTEASGLILSHAILDELATDLCSISAKHDSSIWVENVSARKVEFGEVLKHPTEKISEDLISGYIDQLRRESLSKRVAILHCKYPPTRRNFWIAGEEYQFDLARLETLDKERQGILHRLTLPEKGEAQWKDDLDFLENTSTYLISLLGDYYKLPLLHPKTLVLSDLETGGEDALSLKYEGLLLTSALMQTEPESEFINYRGAVYVRTAGGAERLPIVSPLSEITTSHHSNQIAFIRYRKRTRSEDLNYSIYDESPAGIAALYIADSDGSGQNRLFQEGPYSEDGENEYTKIFDKYIRGIANPQFSHDDLRIYFQVPAWTTSSAIFYFELATESVHYLTNGSSFQVLIEGPHAGSLLVRQHRYYSAPHYGSYDHHWLVTSSGQILFDYDEMLAEKKSEN